MTADKMRQKAIQATIGLREIFGRWEGLLKLVAVYEFQRLQVARRRSHLLELVDRFHHFFAVLRQQHPFRQFVAEVPPAARTNIPQLRINEVVKKLKVSRVVCP